MPVRSGALWLCGKHVVGPDPDAALARVGATTVVCLTERHELLERYPEYLDWLHGSGGHRAVWFPIPDLHAPPFVTAAPFVAGLVARLEDGEHLVVHCGAGIGRAGTIAACILLRLGSSPEQALASVAASRPMAGPEVGAQRDLVEQFAAASSPSGGHRL